MMGVVHTGNIPTSGCIMGVHISLKCIEGGRLGGTSAFTDKVFFNTPGAKREDTFLLQ